MKLPVLMIWSLVATLPAAAQRIRLPSSLGDLEKAARTDSNDWNSPDSRAALGYFPRLQRLLAAPLR
jgi:hypothetical protein